MRGAGPAGGPDQSGVANGTGRQASVDQEAQTGAAPNATSADGGSNAGDAGLEPKESDKVATWIIAVGASVGAVAVAVLAVAAILIVQRRRRKGETGLGLGLMSKKLTIHQVLHLVAL